MSATVEASAWPAARLPELIDVLATRSGMARTGVGSSSHGLSHGLSQGLAPPPAVLEDARELDRWVTAVADSNGVEAVRGSSPKPRVSSRTGPICSPKRRRA